jgi:hypothetical protein
MTAQTRAQFDCLPATASSSTLAQTNRNATQGKSAGSLNLNLFIPFLCFRTFPLPCLMSRAVGAYALNMVDICISRHCSPLAGSICWCAKLRFYVHFFLNKKPPNFGSKLSNWCNMCATLTGWAISWLKTVPLIAFSDCRKIGAILLPTMRLRLLISVKPPSTHRALSLGGCISMRFMRCGECRTTPT